jgi:hypothetical protein
MQSVYKKPGSQLRCRCTYSYTGFGGSNFHVYCFLSTSVTGAHTQLKSKPTYCLKTVIVQEIYMVRECLLSFGTESFVFQFVIKKFKDENIQNYNFACCFVWV